MQKQLNSEILNLPLNGKNIRTIAMRLTSALLISTAVGCATLPEQAKIAKFGEAAADLSSSVELAYVNHVKLVDNVAQDDEAINYLTGRRFTFPPEPLDAVIEPDLWQTRIATVAALQSYATELSKISEPGAAARVSASAEQLSSAIIKFGTALNGSSSTAADIIPATIGAITRSATEQIIARQVRSTLQEMQPYIDLASQSLAEDTRHLQALPSIDWVILQANQKTILASIRRDHRVNSNELYNQYYASLKLYESRSSLIDVYSQIPRTIASFAKAHKAMAESSDDDRALDEFLLLSNQLRIVVQQFASR